MEMDGKIQLICEICANDDEGPSSSMKTAAKLFHDRLQLRIHLIEEHAKYVARALLAPKLDEKLHSWLLANVDYSANTNSGFDKAEDQTNCTLAIDEESANWGVKQQQDVYEQAELAPEALQITEGTNNGDATVLTLEMLLKGILNTTTTGKEGTLATDNLSSPAALELTESDEGGATNQALDLEVFGTAFKTLLFPQSVESPHSDDSDSNARSRVSLVDSKAVRKAHCQVCNLAICSTARQRHVYMVHLKKKDLFKCPHCEYTNSNSVWEVQKHSRVQHGKDAKPLSQEEKHKLEIQMWSQLCFPEWKQKPMKRKADDGFEEGEEEESSVEDKRRREEEDGCAELLDGMELVQGLFAAASREEEEGEVEYVADEEGHSRTQTPAQQHLATEEGAEMNDRLCHLCMEESKYPGRHIAQRHLKRPLYECPICLKFGSYESCTVNKHIQKVHPKEAHKTVPISNLEKYADEIRELQTRCFPNRQMKLVRPISTSNKQRPRERHQCGICSADVAQSDRARHILHKHLRRGKIFECPIPGCEFASNYDIHRVKWHIKWDHKEFVDGAGISLEPISHEAKYRDEIEALNVKCFPGWQRKRQIGGADEASSLMNYADFGRIAEESATLNAKRTDIEDTDGMDGYDVEEDELDEPKSQLDGLMAKALKTIEMAMKRDSSTPDERARSLLDLEGAANAYEWTCQLCHIQLKPGTNLLRHVAKDHLNLPLYQCPVCENHGAHSAYEVRSHMLRSHGDTAQEPLSSLDEHLADIESVYKRCFPCKEFKAGGSDRANFVETTSRLSFDEARVRCKECHQDMKTEDRQIHVYRHHLREPRLYECPACDFSHYACSSDVRNHIMRAHKNQPDLMPRANLLRYSKEIAEWNERCFPGWINRRLPASVVEDFNSCRLCGMDVRQTSRHIAEHHLHIPLHQCPLCEYGAAEARLVQRHMRNNHTMKECEGLEPIANVEKHRGEFSELHNQCFPGRPKRLSNITIADESRRAKCRGCGQTISKKRRLIHLLEKHLQKPVYKCKYCLFTATHERAAVEAHQREKHAGKNAHVLSTLLRHKAELKRLATECFNEPDLKLEDC